MNKESKSKFNLWLSEHPESFHPSDEARMFLKKCIFGY